MTLFATVSPKGLNPVIANKGDVNSKQRGTARYPRHPSKGFCGNRDVSNN